MSLQIYCRNNKIVLFVVKFFRIALILHQLKKLRGNRLESDYYGTYLE